MKADGGRIGFQDGLNFKKFYEKKLDKAIEKMLEQETEEDKNILKEGEKELNKKMLDTATNISQTKPTRDKFLPGKQGDKEYELALDKYYETEKGKKEKENEMFKMVEEFQTLKKNGILRPDETFRNFQKMKEQRLVKNKILELDIKYPEKEIINKETGALNEENLKEAIDQAQVDLEISPIDGLKLKRSLNTEGEQSVTSGSFNLDNLTFSSPNLEEGKLTTTGSFNLGDIKNNFGYQIFPDVDLTGKIDSNDGKILNTELGFDYGNKTLTGKLNESDGYRSTELDLNKTFPINDKFNLNFKGNTDFTTSDLKPTLSYNDGILSADISKSILKGSDTPNLNVGASFPLFEKTFTGDLILDENGRPTYNSDGTLKRKSNTTKDMGVVTLKGTDLFTDNMGGTIGYQKEFGNKNDDLFFTVGGEKDLFDDNYTAGVGLKYKFAEGGIAGLRQSYVGGGGVNLARRGFLKVLAGTGAAVAAFKTGALKLLGKTTTKAAPKLFTAAEGSGAPAWFEGMVNKVLADGVDITKKAATMDGQTVKSLDTPTGKVDVTIDRTGNIDVNYMGDNTALGEGVNMRYVVGQADEMTKVKPFDEFEAIENIPEGKAYGADDYEIEMGENVTDNVGSLFSDTTELAELGGQKTLTKDIVETVKKKKVLKQMENNPSDFVTDVQGDFIQFDDIDPNIPD